ncbi:tRNA pseudouridine(55) synthase TruB [[Clostridium] innocuum]|uniref:tRNA pseudouridine(55) synthase TruB n=1 Tax=Clostridium innocuum TaxID=1522 RepID=UPI00214735DC
MDGILLINKEQNMTSHDVVARLRRILHTTKIGHSGTLDPNATGVLLVLIGKACKALPFLEDTDKEYIATLQLGMRTISDDIWTEPLEEAPIQPIADFQSVLDSFRGVQKQVPPMISSVRVNGKKLYEYAREGKEVARPEREVTIYDIEALDVQRLQFRVSCSSGTYVRSLCHDIAQKTGNLGCMSSLVRTKVGRFSLDECVTLQDVQEGRFQLHTLQEVLSHYEPVEYERPADIYNGKKITLGCAADAVAITHNGSVVAIYQREDAEVFRCVRGLW